MTQTAFHETEHTPEAELTADEVLAMLGPHVSKLNSDLAILQRGSKAICASLRQIVFLSRNNGSVQHEKIVEILKRNGVFHLHEQAEPPKTGALE